MTKSDREEIIKEKEDGKTQEPNKKAPPEAPVKITATVVVNYLKTAVIEPYIIFFMFAFMGRGIITASFFKDKSCQIGLGYSRDICQNLTHYKDIEIQVQKMTNNYHTASSLIGLLPAIVTNIFLSSWSDSYGRKIPIIIGSVGFIIEMIGLIWNAAQFDLPMWCLILPSIPSGLSGSIMVVMTSAVSYISDVSDSSTRVLRFAMFEVAFILAGPIGTAVCGALYGNGEYVRVFSVCLGVNVAGLVFLIIRLKEKRKKRLRDFKEAMRSLLSFENVKLNLKTCTKKRTGTIRKEIVIALCFSVLNLMGTATVEFLFVNKMYAWSNFKLSMVSMATSMLKGAAALLSVPLLSQKLKISDVMLALIGVLSTLAMNLLKAVAYQPWLFYYASVTGLFSGLTGIGVRSRLSKLVPKDEAGSVFSVLTLCESLTPVVGLTLFSQLYNASVGVFPGLTFCISALLLFAPIGVFIWILRNGDEAPYEYAKETFDFDLSEDPDVPNTSNI